MIMGGRVSLRGTWPTTGLEASGVGALGALGAHLPLPYMHPFGRVTLTGG